MVSRREMIEYVAYGLQNNIPQKQLDKMFADKGIIMSYTNSMYIQDLQRLYTQIVDIYQNKNTVDQFINALKKSALVAKVQTFPGFPHVFIKFYFGFLELIDYFTPLKESLRSTIVHQLLQLPFKEIVMKYDYYFTNTPVLTLKSFSTRESPLRFISSYTDEDKEYIIGIFDSKVAISDYTQTKTFTLGEGAEFSPYSLSVGNGRFIILSFVPAGLQVVDFNTGQIEFTELKTESQFSGIQSYCVNGVDKIVVTSYTEVFILNQILEVEHTIDTEVRGDGLVIYQNKEIITLNASEEQPEISFWNPNDQKINQLILPPADVMKYQRYLKLLKDKLIVAFSSGRIQLIDLKNNNAITTLDQYDDPQADDNDILRDIIVRDNDFIVLFEGYIRMYNEDGNMIKEIQVEDIKRIFALPSGEILGTNEQGPGGFIRIYNLNNDQTRTYAIDIDEDPSMANYWRISTVSSNGKFILINGKGDLLVYK